VTGVDSPQAGLAAARHVATGFAQAVPAGTGFATNRRAGEATLAGRLTALARMTQVGFARAGHDGFSPELLREAEGLLGRAGERLRMSADHTVVVLAGGTGSGKSSLFNRLAGADFSPVGVVRPMTREAYACIWGMEGAGPLLEWLGVRDRNRYARSSALDEGERSLGGLLLLDLPDHDSVLAGQSGSVNRLVSLADLMIWVLDPQKYADAAVHSRYLMPMAGHSSVIAVVLNQADLLEPGQVDDCVSDLQRLLETEGLHDTRVLVTSAVTGSGLDELREVLTQTVSARRASTERIAADVDALAARFVPYAGEAGAPGVNGLPWADAGGHTETGGEAGQGGEAGGDGKQALTLPAGSQVALADAFSQAAGVPGVGSALQSARELKAVDHVGWPVSWLADRLLRRDPVRKIRLGNLWDELRGLSAGPAGAQGAEIDNAITSFADEAGPGLPAPWPATIRSAARSRVDDIPGGLGAAIAQSLPAENSVLPWWRLVAAWQGLLLGGAVAGLAWCGLLIAVGVFHVSRHAAPLFSDVMLLPWVAVMVAAVLLLGWLTATGCMTLVARAAGREREQAERQMRSAIAEVALQLVIVPVEQELSVFARFREELAIARGRA
jgi:GTP-binding protein EngB required for normal cell division